MSSQFEPIRIVVPGMPQGKGRPRFTRKGGGRAYTPAQTRAYEAALGVLAKAAMRGRPLLLGPVHVSVRAYFAVPISWSKRKREQAFLNIVLPTGKPDHDNIAKLTDALNGIVWLDDSQVTDSIVMKRYSDTPRLVIQVQSAAYSIPLPHGGE